MSRDTVYALQQLLAAALTGDITGIAFAATLQSGLYITDVTGECVERPTFARGIVRSLDDELAELVNATDLDERR